MFRQSVDVRTGSSALSVCVIHRSSVSLLQPGVCHATVLRIVPSEEVSETFKVDTEIAAPSQSEPQNLVSSLAEYLQSLHNSLLPEKLHNTPPTVSVCVCVCLSY